MGVNKLLMVVMVAQGLFLQRQHDGSLRVMATNGELPNETGSNLRADVTVPSGALESACQQAEYRELDRPYDAPIDNLPTLDVADAPVPARKRR